MRVASATLAVTVASLEQNSQTVRLPLFPFVQMTKNPFGGVRFVEVILEHHWP